MTSKQGPGADLRADLARRLPLYGSDWRDGVDSKVPAASVFLFFACLAPAVAFGGMMSLATDGNIGAVEMIVATSVCGVAYALLSGQPLTILGGTGPLLVFTALLFDSCGALKLPFLPVYGWIGLWTGLFVILLGVFGVSRFISRFTRFTDEIFAALISLIFIWQAVRSVLSAFPAAHVADSSALLGLVLAVGTWAVASALARLRHSPLLSARVRNVLADFGPAVAIVIMVLLREQLPDVHLETLNVPTTFATTSGRPWLVSLLDVPMWAIAASAVPAALVALLVFLDQNITVRIVQNPEHGLKKGDAYHWDLALVGALIAACSMFGLPWLVAATVRSVNHVKALVVREPDGNVRTVENRVSPLVIHLLLGLSLLATEWLRLLPMAVLFGLFLYMGLASIQGSQLFERLKLFITDPSLFPSSHYVHRVPARTIHLFTAVQVACLALLWIVKVSPAGILFPMLIALLVPVRALLGRFIAPEHLAALDADETVADAEDELG